MKRRIAGLLTAALMLAALCSCGRADDGKYRIALISLDSVDQHWVYMNEGAQKAARECGCTVTFMSPGSMDDALSIEQINNAVAAQYDALLFAAGSHDAPVAALREADQAGVKIFYVDAHANYPAVATFGTNNYVGAIEAGKNTLRLLTEAGVTEGKIGIIGVKKSLPAVEARIDGFCEVFKDTAFEILEVQQGEGDIAKSQEIAENYITQGVVAIYGTNESGSTGMGNALKAAKDEDIIAVGFDNSDAITALRQEGYVRASIVQNPNVMGYEAVRAAVAVLDGKDIGEVEMISDITPPDPSIKTPSAAGDEFRGRYYDTGVNVYRTGDGR